MPTLKVMTWNLEKLFLPDADATDQVCERFAAKIANLAAVIDQEQPDLLALQEIGPDGALEALQKALAHPMPHACARGPAGRAWNPCGLPFDTSLRPHRTDPTVPGSD
jgi:hypothetical protein